MSGELVGLVVTQGPQDLHDFAVAVVIAEDMHHAADTATLSLDALAGRARLSRSTAKRVVKRLREAGWIAYAPGGGRGIANRYRLRIEAFSTGPETGSEGPGLPHEKQGQGEPVSGLNRVRDDVNRVPGTLSTVPVGSPSRAGDENRFTTDPLPVVVGVRTGPDDDTLRTALDTFGVVASRTLAAEVGKALDRGHTASGINAHLRAHVNAANSRDLVAVLVSQVRALPAVLETVAPPRCGECDENRMRSLDDGTPYRCPVCHPKADRRDDAPPTPREHRPAAVLPPSVARTASRDDLLAAQRDRSRAASAGMRRRA